MAKISSAPRPLIAWVVILVAARIAIVFVVDSPWLTALGWAGLLAALGVGALLGKRPAAQALACLCLVLGADTLMQLLTVSVPHLHLIAALLWGALCIGAGAYILLGNGVRRFYS